MNRVQVEEGEEKVRGRGQAITRISRGGERAVKEKNEGVRDCGRGGASFVAMSMAMEVQEEKEASNKKGLV